jgi:carboxyl-terminal processing protease
MSIRSKLTLITLSVFIAVYSIVGGLLSTSSNPWVKAIADPGPYPQLRIFEEVVRHVVNDYVEKPDLEKVRIGALRGLTEALDPYSAYLLPQAGQGIPAEQESTRSDWDGDRPVLRFCLCDRCRAGLLV